MVHFSRVLGMVMGWSLDGTMKTPRTSPPTPLLITDTLDKHLSQAAAGIFGTEDSQDDIWWGCWIWFLRCFDGFWCSMDQTWRPESVAGCDPIGQRLPENNFHGFKKMALIYCIHAYIYIYYYNRLSTLNTSYGSVSKPCTPGEHQNSW